ncbi:MAG: hypothetical protein QXZ43_02995 [Candidatus Aenigmatarchaeota archaeon]
MKKYLLPILLLLLLNPVLAVTVSCGTPEGLGNYRFYNRDYNPVRVFINTGGTSISVYPNNFDIPVGGSQLVEFRAPTNTYAQLFVTYTDNTNSISASLQCNFYATSGSSSSTTTTTIQQGASCSSYTDASSCRSAGCTWITVGLSGYCTGTSSSTTTTVSQTTTTVVTTTQPSITTTTTQTQSSCSGRSFSTCSLIPGCEWVGSMNTGYCRSVSVTTTTVIETTPVTTTTTINTGSNTGGSGSSSSSTGSSSSGSSSSTGSSSSGTGKSTGFYDFPSFIQILANGEKTIKGTFYAAKDLSDIKFQVADIDANWFTITPSSLTTIKKGETVNLTVTIKVPENAKQDSYVFKLVAKTNVNYEKSLTLAVTEKISTTVATTVTTTTIEQKQPSTGFFAKAGELALNYWYFVLIPVVLIATLSILPLISSKKSKGSAYAIVEDDQDYREDFVELKIKEPEKPKEIQIEKPKRDINEAIRKKVIKEIRERVMKDKKH